MAIFGILAIIAAILYLFYRFLYFKNKLPYYRQWISSKATIALGLFMLFFGLDQIILWKDKVAMIIGIVFSIVGVIYAWQGYQTYKFYRPKAMEEARKKHKEEL